MSEKITAIEELILDSNASCVKATKKLEEIFTSIKESRHALFAQMPIDYIDRMFIPRRDHVEHHAYILGGFNGTSGDHPIHTPFHSESDPYKLHNITFYPDTRMRLDLTTLVSHEVRVGVEMSRQPMIDAGRLLLSLTMVNLNETEK